MTWSNKLTIEEKENINLNIEVQVSKKEVKAGDINEETGSKKRSFDEFLNEEKSKNKKASDKSGKSNPASEGSAKMKPIKRRKTSEESKEGE